MYKLAFGLLWVLFLAGSVSAKNFYVDVIICEQPPPSLEFATVKMQVNVWDANDLSNIDVKTIYPTLSSETVSSTHLLSGSPKKWHAAVPKGWKIVRGYDGKYYQISWQNFVSLDNKISNITAIHVDLTWQVVNFTRKE